MQVARLTLAAQCRFDRPFRISPLTIYEAKFREKLTKNFRLRIRTDRKSACLRLSDIEDYSEDEGESFPSAPRHG